MQTDLDLLDAWRRGDEEAGNTLFDRHFEALYGFFRNKAWEGADDLVQKTFLACIEGRDRFRGDASFRTYMFATARRVFYRELDHRRRDEVVDYGVTSLHVLALSPAGALVQRNEQRIVLEALRHLPVDFQVAVELYYIQGFRGPELAAILDVPEATVRSRVRRGLARLRERVEALAGSPGLVRATVESLESWTASLGQALQPGEDARLSTDER